MLGGSRGYSAWSVVTAIFFCIYLLLFVTHSPETGARAIHRSAKRRADDGSKAAPKPAADSPAAKADAETSTIASLFKTLSASVAKPTDSTTVAQTAALNQQRATAIDSFFKQIRTEAQEKSAKLPPTPTPATNAEGKPDQLSGLFAVLQKMSKDNTAAPVAPRRPGRESTASLFDQLFTPPAVGTGAPSLFSSRGDEALTKLFGSTTAVKARTDEFRYWNLFPREVQKWLLYTRTPPVRFWGIILEANFNF